MRARAVGGAHGAHAELRKGARLELCAHAHLAAQRQRERARAQSVGVRALGVERPARVRVKSRELEEQGGAELGGLGHRDVGIERAERAA